MASSSSLGGIPRVLVVDGDADSRALYCDSLTRSGCHVTEAGDGREALVQALIAKPWVIVTELTLPIIDGISLCEILRQDTATATLPILVVTSETRAEELARAKRAGADTVLIKPTMPEVVISEVRRMIHAAAPAVVPPTPPMASTRRKSLVKAHRRLSTITPDTPPISLACPVCNRPLRYHETYIGGVSSRQSERWDYYVCSRCGLFQYRYRTRKLRQLS